MLVLLYLNIQGATKSLGRNAVPVCFPFYGQQVGGAALSPYTQALQPARSHLQVCRKLESALRHQRRQVFDAQIATLPSQLGKCRLGENEGLLRSLPYTQVRTSNRAQFQVDETGPQRQCGPAQMNRAGFIRGHRQVQIGLVKLEIGQVDFSPEQTGRIQVPLQRLRTKAYVRTMPGNAGKPYLAGK